MASEPKLPAAQSTLSRLDITKAVLIDLQERLRHPRASQVQEQERIRALVECERLLKQLDELRDLEGDPRRKALVEEAMDFQRMVRSRLLDFKRGGIIPK